MQSAINKDTFKQSVKSRFTATQKDLKFFNSFFFLNESGNLPPGLQKNRNAGRLKLANDKDLREQYYLFHLLQTIDTKWKTFNVFDIVTNYYKSSNILNEILKELVWKAE